MAFLALLELLVFLLLLAPSEAALDEPQLPERLPVELRLAALPEPLLAEHVLLPGLLMVLVLVTAPQVLEPPRLAEY